jgi:hypothetical protein
MLSLVGEKAMPVSKDRVPGGHKKSLENETFSRLRRCFGVLV